MLYRARQGMASYNPCIFTGVVVYSVLMAGMVPALWTLHSHVLVLPVRIYIASKSIKIVSDCVSRYVKRTITYLKMVKKTNICNE